MGGRSLPFHAAGVKRLLGLHAGRDTMLRWRTSALQQKGPSI